MTLTASSCKKDQDPPKPNYTVFLKRTGGDNSDLKVYLSLGKTNISSPEILAGTKITVPEGEVVHWSVTGSGDPDTLRFFAIDSSRNKTYIDRQIIIPGQSSDYAGEFVVN